jgi:hypothetical protein
MSLIAALPIIGDILDKIFPDKTAAEAAKVKLMELAQSGELAKLNADVTLASGQLEVNKVEASSDGVYKGGWRPAIGYICAIALFYNYIGYPIAVFYVTLNHPGMEIPGSPVDDNMWELLLGMLGLGGLRTWEKVKK